MIDTFNTIGICALATVCITVGVFVGLILAAVFLDR